MTFELQPRSDSWWPEPETLRRLELTHDVTVSVPQRNRDSAVLVTLMAMERNVGTWGTASGDVHGWRKGGSRDSVYYRQASPGDDHISQGYLPPIVIHPTACSV